MKKGFTLIELLVVIAIIGLLSSVVLASLNSARLKAKDAAIKQTMVSLRSQAQVYASNNGNSFDSAVSPPHAACSLVGSLWNDPTVVKMYNSLNSYIASNGLLEIHCASQPDKWILVTSLPTDASGETMFCVDSAGSARVAGYTGNPEQGFDGLLYSKPCDYLPVAP